MTDDEYSSLDEILMEHIDDCLSIDEAHGFLTTMLVSQVELTNEDCVESIYGDSQFEKTAYSEVTSLILSMYCDIQKKLASNTPFDILVIETEEDGELVEVFEGWCYGFMLAVSQEAAVWNSLEKNEHAILSPIAKLALLVNDETLEMEDDEYELLVELLPGSVIALNTYFINKPDSA